MLSAFTNSMKIPELRSRIFYTLALLFISRVGAHIPLPGLDPAPLQRFFTEQVSGAGGALVGLYNMFTGGALVKGAVCALGIMPYISAQIIFQLMTAVVPSLSRLQQEGDVGRQKLTQYTRYATLLICVVQGALLILALENPAKLFSGYDVNVYGDIIIVNKAGFLATSVVFMTAGTMLLMWLGEQITQRGIGNGVSLLITIGILADVPGAAQTLKTLIFAPVGVQGISMPQLLMMVVLFIIVIAGIIMVTQGQRKIPVQYAKRVIGQKVYGGQSSFLPLKVNYSGVMPVIFAAAILLFPQQILSQLGAAFNLKFLSQLAGELSGGFDHLKLRHAAFQVRDGQFASLPERLECGEVVHRGAPKVQSGCGHGSIIPRVCPGPKSAHRRPGRGRCAAPVFAGCACDGPPRCRR